MRAVKDLREAEGWTQNQLAFHAGLATSVVSQVENGKRDPSASTLKKLAEALGVNVSDLFRGEEAPKASAPPSDSDERRRLDDGAGDRSLRYLRAWRAFAGDLALEWGEKPPRTSREIAPLVSALGALVDAGVFENTGDDDTAARGELSLFRNALAKLYKIADRVESDEVAAELRRGIALVPRDRNVA